MNVVTQLTQFVGSDVINKNMTDLAVELSCVTINTHLVVLLSYSLSFELVTYLPT